MSDAADTTHYKENIYNNYHSCFPSIHHNDVLILSSSYHIYTCSTFGGICGLTPTFRITGTFLWVVSHILRLETRRFLLWRHWIIKLSLGVFYLPLRPLHGRPRSEISHSFWRGEVTWPPRVKKNSAERLSGPLRFRRLRGMSYAERRSHVVQIWQNRKKGEYDVVKHLKYNNISIYFFCEYESSIISILSMKYMHLCLSECQWNTP